MTALTRPRALTPLRHRGFRLLTIGQVTSNVGDACYAVALPWYVLAVHGGPLLLGTVLAAYGIPRTALIAVGGYASDRWRPQSVMLAADITRAVVVAVLAVTAHLGPARAVVLVPIAVVIGAGEGLFLPGSFSVIPVLLPHEDLQAANALASSGTQAATLAGPVLGGAVMALAGPSLTFGLDALTFAVSAVTLALLVHRPARAAAAGAEPAAAAVAAGQAADPAGPAPTLLSLFRTERVLLVVLLLNVAANIGMGGMDSVALPALVHGPLHAGAAGYAVTLAGFGTGALAGTLAVAQVRPPRRPVVVASLVFLAEAAFIAVTPFLGSTWGVAAAMAGIGVTNGFGNILTMTAFQRWAHPELRGRLTSLLILTSFGVYPVSVALAALIVRDLGPAPFFLFAAVTLAAALIGGLTQRAWRDFGADTGPRSPAGAPGPAGRVTGCAPLDPA